MSLFNEEPVAPRVSLEGQTLSEELQDLPSAGSQKGKSASDRPRLLEDGPLHYRVGWQLLESTSIAGMKLDHITADNALTIEESRRENQ